MSDVDAEAAVTAGESGAGQSAADLILGAGAGGGGDGGKPADGGAGEPPAWWNDLPGDPVGDKPSHQDWVKAKGLQSPTAVIESYRALEATLGGDKVPVPKGDDDKDGWERLYKAAGRPDAPEGYALDTIAGVDANLAKGFAAKAHEMGLNPRQAKAAVEFQLGMVADAQAQIVERNRNEAHALAAAMGADFKEGMERAVRAGLATGLTEDQVAKVRDAVGPKTLFKLLDTVARSIAEDTMEGDGKRGGQKTAEQLATRKAEILASKELRQKLNDGDPTLKAEWAQIAEAEGELLKEKRGKAA